MIAFLTNMWAALNGNVSGPDGKTGSAIPDVPRQAETDVSLAVVSTPNPNASER